MKQNQETIKTITNILGAANDYLMNSAVDQPDEVLQANIDEILDNTAILKTTYEQDYEGKKKFVEQRLKPLLTSADMGIVDVTYSVVNGDEYIWTVNKNASKNKRICVTADSLMALVQDVMSKGGANKWMN